MGAGRGRAGASGPVARQDKGAGMKWLKQLFGGSKGAPAPVATLGREPGHLHVVRIGGIVSKGTIDKIQAEARRDIEKGVEEIKVLVVLQDFRGWERGDAWADIDFFATYGDRITRIAVLGEAKWEEETLLFLAAGRRKGEVRYFPPDAEAAARAWLMNVA